METTAWTRPVGAGERVQVTLETEDPDAAVVRYRLAFPFLVGDGPLVTGGGALEEHALQSQSGVPVSDLVVTIPNEHRVERLIAWHADERIVIHLPSAVLLETIEEAIGGIEAAVAPLLAAFDSPVQVPLVCGSFLGVQATVDLVQAVVRVDRHAQSLLHSYRYAVVRSALVSRAGLRVDSADELETLVSGLDAIDEIGAVSTVDALADVMATVHATVAETDDLLASLGYDVDALDVGDDDLLAVCYLAQLVCRAGLEAAERYELRQDLPSTADYDRRKRAALRSAYGDRGRAWRQLLNDARRQSPAEYRSVLASTLYWTAEESRSDSRLAELLHRAAEAVADVTGDRRIKYGARYNRYLAAGHRLRGTHCYRPAIANFERAERLAADYRFLAAWKPILAKGLVQARLESTHGNHAAALEVLDETLDALLLADPPDWAATRSVHHLEAQKRETEAELVGSDNPRLAHERLAAAVDHYEVIGFQRSLDRVRRKLASYEDAIRAEARADGPELEGREAVEPAGQPASTGSRETGEGGADPAADSEPARPAGADDPAAELERYADRFEDPYLE